MLSEGYKKGIISHAWLAPLLCAVRTLVSAHASDASCCPVHLAGLSTGLSHGHVTAHGRKRWFLRTCRGMSATPTERTISSGMVMPSLLTSRRVGCGPTRVGSRGCIRFVMSPQGRRNQWPRCTVCKRGVR